jgi:hypothetical protein
MLLNRGMTQRSRKKVKPLPPGIQKQGGIPGMGTFKQIHPLRSRGRALGHIQNHTGSTKPQAPDQASVTSQVVRKRIAQGPIGTEKDPNPFKSQQPPGTPVYKPQGQSSLYMRAFKRGNRRRRGFKSA